MKKLSATMWEVVDVLLWGRHLSAEASLLKPSKSVVLVQRAVASIQIDPVDDSLAEISVRPVNLSKGISRSFGTV
ncbi:MAG: hypothetical protein M0009_08925 [Deltaproteobacteria bacterium]|nr:hypothetical protein [Deltaproteobacteria bacterium]